MNTEARLKICTVLSGHLQKMAEDTDGVMRLAKLKNPWFVPRFTKKALLSLAEMTSENSIEKLRNAYDIKDSCDKTIGIIMAGNIPAVGFHDFLIGLVSGASLQIKTSSEDEIILKEVLAFLWDIEPELKTKIQIVEKLDLETLDAVIATGSDNTARYFDYYFSKVPNIIRKNRTSCAILSGNETDEQLKLLAEDIYSYFGMGCRSVSKLFIPAGYDMATLIPHFDHYSELWDHVKYANNYQYHKSILLVNRVDHLDNGFTLFSKNEALVSPLSVLYYDEYHSDEKLDLAIQAIKDKVQVVVGKGTASIETVPFGQAQNPSILDYADNVDTMAFILGL